MTLALPSTRDEAWRWSDLSALPGLADAQPNGGVVDTSDLWLNLGGPRLLFVDGRLDTGLSEPGDIAIDPVDPSDRPPARRATGRRTRARGLSPILMPLYVARSESMTMSACTGPSGCGTSRRVAVQAER